VAGWFYLATPVRNKLGVDILAGRQFAERNCARCHAVGQTGVSPFDPAPPFRIFARRWPLDSLDESLAEGIVVGHPDMPEFKLTPRQIGNFIGYLETIQR
jgi:mono/diheme cytochrome c family protein